MGTTQSGPVVRPDELTIFCEELFVAAGVPRPEAVVVAASLVDANLIGLDSHGVSRVADYLGRLDKGLIEPQTRLEVVAETAGTAVIDAHNGWGQVASQRAVELAVAKAREVGVAWIGVRNSNHNGTARFWTSKIAGAGMVALSGTNGSPVMAPFGSLDESLGTNPISVAVPSSGDVPVVLDMATSAQARGKILLAAKNEEPIPEGWALTKDGYPTTDPHEAWEGILLPAAGPKGSGLAMMVDILSGVLTGANFGATMPRMYTDPAPQLLGHLFIALDVEAFMPLEEFRRRMGDREQQTRGSRPVPGSEAVFMPGDLEAAKHQTHSRVGIAISEAVHDELLELAGRLGVPPLNVTERSGG